MKIVIMAGGKGKRIASVNSEVPKPMIPVLEKPILQHQIEALSRQGYRDYIMIVGHLGHVIMDYFQDGSRFGVQIEYIVEEEPLGTAGALYYLKDRIDNDFLLINGDIIFDVDIGRMIRAHQENGCEATILTHPNSHPYDSGVIMADGSGKVLRWLHKEDERRWYKNRVNAGIHMLSERFLNRFTEAKKTDLDRDLLKKLISQGELYAYDSPEYVKDMGTPGRYQEVVEDIASGKVKRRNLQERQKAIFLDRDGTINVYKGFLRDPEELELLPGAAEAIRRINNSGYLAIVVTNQPVIARGEVSFDGLEEIHNKLETLLGQEGAYLDDIFLCPHHPHKGYEGERPEYKMECGCRKPKPGLLLQAAGKYHIDLGQSWMAGDSGADVEAGKAAGCRSVLLGAEAECDYRDLKDFIDHIL